MKKHFFIFLILYLLIIAGSYGQSVDSSALRSVQLIQKIVYAQGTAVYSSDKLFYKTNDTKFIFPWENLKKYDHNTLISAIDTLQRFGRLNVKPGGFLGPQIEFKSQFPVNMISNDDIFEIRIIENKLKDSLNRSLTTNTVATNFGSKINVRSSGGKTTTDKWQTLTANFGVETETIGSTFTGSVVFKAEYMTGYQYVKITSKDIGKEYTLNNQKFKVIDIFENKLIIAPVTDEKIDIRFSFVNLNNNNQEIKSLSIEEFSKLKEKDSSLTFGSMTQYQFKLHKIVYEQFRKSHSLDFENFSNNTSAAFLNNINAKKNKEKSYSEAQFLGPRYTIIVTSGPIQNMYLYVPVYGVTKDFEIKF